VSVLLEARKAAAVAPPDSPVLYQNWRDLLFLHWAIPAELIQSTLPEGLSVDTYEGNAYVGVVPFRMRKIRPRFLFSVPFLSEFLELNLRTYVYDREGVPGVWFYSLDANQRMAVWIARTFFALNYVSAEMSYQRDTTGVHHFCSRRPGAETQSFRYRGNSASDEATPGGLEYFLVERYYLHCIQGPKSRLFRGQVHHRPYPIHQAEVSEWSAKLFSLNGLDLPPGPPDHVLYSPGVDVSIFPLKPVD